MIIFRRRVEKIRLSGWKGVEGFVTTFLKVCVVMSNPEAGEKERGDTLSQWPVVI